MGFGFKISMLTTIKAFKNFSYSNQIIQFKKMVQKLVYISTVADRIYDLK